MRRGTRAMSVARYDRWRCGRLLLPTKGYRSVSSLSHASPQLFGLRE
jgi:hypothetical protein